MRLLFKILIPVCILGIFLAIAGSFIITNPQAAADITDNYIRPIIGDTTVIYIERIFYNTSDTITRLTFHGNLPLSAPAQASIDIINGQNSNLNLASIPNGNPWGKVILDLFPNQQVAATTYIQPDKDRPYAMVRIIELDTKKISLGIVAGLKEPGGKFGHSGSGKIPQNIIQDNRLIGAFNGGFLYDDGQYGMIADGVIYTPLKQNTATLIGYTDGTLKIINYTGQDLGKNVAFVRQNCPILISNGELSVLDPKNKADWGRTLTSQTYTWRSGIGITKKGTLLYAGGNNLTPITLAYALQAAGAVDAMQLDINPAWVSFNLFTKDRQTGQVSTMPFMKDMRDRSRQYMHGANKDFFYLYKK